MIKFLIAVCLILTVSLVVLIFIIQNKNKKIKSNSEAIQSLIDANNNLHEYIKKVNLADKIKSENRREADEKINGLYDGDFVDNAIKILQNNVK